MPKGGWRGEKHGHAKKSGSSRTYHIWENMRQRCNNPNANHYHRYGGRGIAICPRWDEYAVFLADMGECPSNRHSLERIDNDAGYSPENCRWALHREQCRNTARNVWVEYRGETMLITEAIKASPLSAPTFYRRVKGGMSVFEALNTPLDPRAGRRAKAAA